MTDGLFELTIVILFSAIFGIIARLLKQPIILAYLAAGALIGSFGFFNLADRETFKIFSDLGIMFLLFLIGLEINYSSLRFVGKTSVILGLSQIIFTFVPGFFIARMFNFDNLQSAYIAIALTFSSTVIVVKLLSEKRDLNSLYGKITVGMLLVQDMAAILILMFLAGISEGSGTAKNLVETVVKGGGIFVILFFLGRKFIPVIFDKIGRFPELLFLASISWCLGIAALIVKAGFSIEIGGLLAGLALANSSEQFQISSKLRSLRDFFILIFFVILGSSLIFSNLSGIIIPIIAFSLFVLLGNPLIVLIIMGLLGYRKRTSFLTGLTTAQISEFSLILGALGLTLGHISSESFSLIAAVGAITITLSTYFIVYGEKIFRYLSPLLSFFERIKTIREDHFQEREFEKPIVLVGYGRTGESIALNLPKNKFFVVDFDPSVIEELKKKNFDYIFGDISDEEIFEKANLGKAGVLISTSPDFEDNFGLLKRLNLLRKRPKAILRAETEKDARILYGEGADYILLPNFTAGQYLGKNISVDPKMKILNQLREKDLLLMKKISLKSNQKTYIRKK